MNSSIANNFKADYKENSMKIFQIFKVFLNSATL